MTASDLTASASSSICPACERGRLTPQTITQIYRAPGPGQRTFSVAGIEVDHCVECGNDAMNPDQIRANEARVRQRKAELGLA